MSFQIGLHLMTVLPAMILGLAILLKKKGTPTHKLLGRGWVVLMLVTSTTSFFIKSDGAFSFIHLLSILSIASIAIAIWAIRSCKIKIHRGFMTGTYIGAIFTGIVAILTPGRIAYVFIFGAS
jgi:uncharacterized membrane protein